MRLISSDGTTVVKVINRTLTGHGRDGAWLSVSRYGTFVGEVRTPDQLASLGVDLADMTEVA